MALMLRLTRILALATIAATTAVVLAAQRPPSNSAAAGEWRYYGGDAASTKYSPLGQITRANVNQLQIAWRWSSPDNEIAKANPVARPAGYQDTPIMVNGVLYTTTSLGIYVAIDPATGRTLWQYDPEIWKLGRPPNLGFTHRGTAYWTDGKRRRLISGTHDAHLVSIDAETGKPDPSFGTNGRVDVIRGPPVRAARAQLRHQLHTGHRQERHHRRSEHPGPAADEGTAARRHLRLRCADREEALDLPFDSAERRVRVRDAGKADRRSTPAARMSGRCSPSTRSSATSTCRSARRPTTTTAAIGSATTCLPKASSVSTPGPANGSGISRPSITDSGTTTFRRRRFSWTSRSTGGASMPSRRSASRGSSMCSIARTGAPVWPIEERPVPQSSAPGERTAKTQPFPTKPPPFDRQSMLDDDVIDFTPELRAQALEVLKQWDRGPLFTPPSERGTRADAGSRRRRRLGRRGRRSRERDALRSLAHQPDHRAAGERRSGAGQPSVSSGDAADCRRSTGFRCTSRRTAG